MDLTQLILDFPLGGDHLHPLHHRRAARATNVTSKPSIPSRMGHSGERFWAALHGDRQLINGPTEASPP